MTQEGQCQKRGWPLNARLHRSILMPHKDVEAFRQCKAGSPSGGLGDRTESFFIGAFLVGSPRTVLCHCRRVAPHASLGVDVSNVGQAVEKLGLGGGPSGLGGRLAASREHVDSYHPIILRRIRPETGSAAVLLLLVVRRLAAQ